MGRPAIVLVAELAPETRLPPVGPPPPLLLVGLTKKSPHPVRAVIAAAITSRVPSRTPPARSVISPSSQPNVAKSMTYTLIYNLPHARIQTPAHPDDRVRLRSRIQPHIVWADEPLIRLIRVENGIHIFYA